MKISSVIAFVFLLLSLTLTLTLTLPSNSFDYIQTVYATDAGGDDGDDGGDEGGNDGDSDALNTRLTTVYINPKRGYYTRADIASAVSQWEKGNEVVFIGARSRKTNLGGNHTELSYDKFIINLAKIDPDLAVELLNGWKKLKRGDFAGMVSVLNKIEKQLIKDRKLAYRTYLQTGDQTTWRTIKRFTNDLQLIKLDLEKKCSPRNFYAIPRLRFC